jgi:hypothetical protein
MAACGYSLDAGQDLSITIKRGGVNVNVLPVALEWINDAGQRQIIATPQLGKPIIVDEDGWWCLDAFGPGIDWGARLWSDMVRPVIRIKDPQALFYGFSRPTIAAQGLRLAKTVNIGYDGGLPDRDVLFNQSRFRRKASKARLSGNPDEHRRDPGKVPISHTRGDALWFGEARAWDDGGQGWKLRQDWRRYGDDVTVALSLAAEDVASSIGPLSLDTTMTEQQVGASADDARNGDAAWGKTTVGTFTALGTSANIGFVSSSYGQFGTRFTPPLPPNCSISEASLSLRSSGIGLENPTVLITVENLANAATFSSGTREPSLSYRDRAGTTCTWSIANSWAANTWYGGGSQTDTNDVSAIIGQITSLADWASGNGMVFVMQLSSSVGTATYRGVRTYDFASTSAPKLNATYTEPAPTGLPAICRANFLNMMRSQ